MTDTTNGASFLQQAPNPEVGTEVVLFRGNADELPMYRTVYRVVGHQWNTMLNREVALLAVLHTRMLTDADMTGIIG